MNYSKYLLAVTLLVSLAACKKEADVPTSFTRIEQKELASGECSYYKNNFETLQIAEKFLLAAKNLVTKGPVTVPLIRAEAYPTLWNFDQPIRYGYQLVFSCDDAILIKVEAPLYTSYPAAQNGLDLAKARYPFDKTIIMEEYLTAADDPYGSPNNGTLRSFHLVLLFKKR